MKQDSNQLKAGIVLNYVNMILGNLIPIFYTPVMLSLLGQSEYGLYKLSSSVTSYLSLISLGIGSAITRYLIKSREEHGQEAEEQMLGLFMVVFQVIAVAAMVVGTILTLNLDIWYGKSLTTSELARMKILVFLMVCNTALSFSQSPYVTVVSAHERFIFQQCVNILTTCIGPLLNVIMLILGYASVGMTVSSLVVGVVSRAAYGIYVKRKMKIRARYRNLPVSQLSEILAFSFWVFLATVVGTLNNATDSVMMGAIPELATVGVAVYSVGHTFNQIVISLTTGISNLLSPKVNKMVFTGATNEELTELAIRIGRLQGYIFALVVSGFIAFGQPFIRFYAGEGYEDAYWVAILMMVPNMIPLIQSVCLNVIMAQNKHKFRSLVHLAVAIGNVIGTWFLMQVMGVVGAALMTGITLVIGHGFAMNWYYNKRIGLDMFHFWKECGKVFLIPSLMCTATLILSCWIDLYNLSVMVLGIVLYTVIYCALNWILMMNYYEKNLIREPLIRLTGKMKRNKKAGK